MRERETVRGRGWVNLSIRTRIHRAVLALEQMSREQGQLHPAGPAKWQMTVTMRTSWKLIVMAEHKGRERIPARQWRTLSIQSLVLAYPCAATHPAIPWLLPFTLSLRVGHKVGLRKPATIYSIVCFISRKRKNFCCYLRKKTTKKLRNQLIFLC